MLLIYCLSYLSMGGQSTQSSIWKMLQYGQLISMMSYLLVTVFDTSDLSSLVALKEWVPRTDIQKFDILLCIGNKVDLLPVHSAHTQYKRHLLKLGDSPVNSNQDLSEYGISKTESRKSFIGR